MTGERIYASAVSLLGECAVAAGSDDNIRRMAVEFINKLLYDLGSSADIANLSDKIKANENILQALPFGLAMLICTAVGLTDRQGFFAGVYEARRSKIKACITTRRDALRFGGSENV